MRTGRLTRFLPPALLVVAAVIVVLLAVAIGLRVSSNDRHASRYSTAARAEPVTAARTAAQALLSYDYRTIGDLAAKNSKLLTRSCAAGYTRALDDSLKPQIVPIQGVLTAAVKAAALASYGGERARVLVVVDLSSKNNQRTDTRLDQAAVSLTLLRQHGRWLVDQVSTNSGGGSGCGLS
jgi:Mce-associated membrane protein